MRAQTRSSPSFRCIIRCFTSGSQLCLSDLFSSANRVSFVERVSKVPRLTRSGVSNVSPINRAAVLVPLIKSVDGAPSLLFTERSTQLRSHAGEISYPGGKFDPRYDKSSIDTALRETEEELGLQSKSFEIWAELPPLPSKDGKTSVTPVVGLFKDDFVPSTMKLSAEEVSKVYLIPISDLCRSKNQGFTQFRPGYILPFYFGREADIKPKIWGLTAIITHQVLTAMAPNLYKLKLRPVPAIVVANGKVGRNT